MLLLTYWCLHLGGPDPLSFLNKVAHEGCRGSWTILVGVGEGKARTRRVIAGTNGFKPCRADGVTCRRVEVTD